MDKAAVGADREHLDAQFLQFVEFGGDRRQFGRSDKGEITRIKAQHDPFSAVIGELDVLEPNPFDKRGCFEIWGFMPYPSSGHLDLLLCGCFLSFWNGFGDRTAGWFHTRISLFGHTIFSISKSVQLVGSIDNAAFNISHHGVIDDRNVRDKGGDTDLLHAHIGAHAHPAAEQRLAVCNGVRHLSVLVVRGGVHAVPLFVIVGFFNLDVLA